MQGWFDIYYHNILMDFSINPPFDSSQSSSGTIASTWSHNQTTSLLQTLGCPVCNNVYSTPITLPCGVTICRSCLPSEQFQLETFRRFPTARIFTCPILNCRKNHVITEISADVVIAKFMDALSSVVSKYIKEDIKSVDKSVENTRRHDNLSSLYKETTDSKLCAHEESLQDETMLVHDDREGMNCMTDLLVAVDKDLDCQVCYNLMVEPITILCGHTFCRTCLIRSFDHSKLCPACRQYVLFSNNQNLNSNKVLHSIVRQLYPEQVIEREAAILDEQDLQHSAFDTALFVVSLVFPTCPVYFRIFEPRYRLMIRRALETTSTFGVLMHDSRTSPQGDIGTVQTKQYGTLVRIEHRQIMPDGTSLVECRGISRFKILDYDILDGYTVGKVESLDDITTEEEALMESEDTNQSTLESTIDADSDVDPHDNHLNQADLDLQSELNRKPTAELLQICQDFVEQMKSRSASWFLTSIVRSSGPPPEDAASFSWWFASILMIQDENKYEILKTRSARERLKLLARWVKYLEFAIR